MNRRNLTTGILLGAVAAVTLVLGAAIGVRIQGGRTGPVPTYWDAPDFALTDQAGATLANSDLEGTIWLASFVYTNCPDFCPLVTLRMAEIRDGLAADGLLGSRVRLVSITVDPARDTPEVLRRYAAGFGSEDPSKWAFLTGEPDEVRSIVEGGFKVPAAPMVVAAGDLGSDEAGHAGDGHGHGVADGYTVMHSDHILLIDADGRVRGFYPTGDPAEQKRLERELRAVLEE